MDSIIRKLKKLGIEVIYTDTDSIICNTIIPKDLISSEEIGKLKEEYVDKKIERKVLRHMNWNFQMEQI